jgi:hypothetical protein
VSNKRIQQKRAKSQWKRDKSRLIANFLVWMDPDASRADYLRCARALWKLDRETLFRRIDMMMGYQLRLRSPFRLMKRLVRDE